jgi:hypothetical protein
LNNANGSVSNQPGFMTGAIFDTNSFTYTNDAFKCFDLVLASGANTVTLHAADLAGNLTTSNFVFNLNYSNKPAPVVTLWWPQNGAQISGSSFTWRGTVDDPTVTLSAQITDSNGDVNVVAGVIERNGNFWVDNLPLAPGTNWLTLTATDINNNTNTTNIYVVQSSVALIITYADAITSQTAIIVRGTINVPNYTVWVNGVMETNLVWNGTAYFWSAGNVPVNGGSCAVIQARAIPNSETNNLTGGGGGTNSNLSSPGNPPAPDAVDAGINQLKAPRLICTSAHTSYTEDYTWLVLGLSVNKLFYSDIINWSSQSGGNELNNYWLYGTDNFGDPYGCFTIFYNQWDTNGNGTSQSASTYYWASESPPSLGSPVPFSGGQTTFTTGLQGQLSALAGPPGTVTQSASTRFNLATDGLSQPGYYSLFQISSSGDAYAAIDPTYYCDDWSNMPAPPPVKVGGHTLNLFQPINGGTGYYYCNLAIPAGEQVDMTAIDTGYAFASATPSATPIPITGLTVVSNATQINSSTNWATVMSNGGYVTLQATLSTNDPNLAPFIHWSCGQPVPGQPFQRQVSTSVATNFTVTASSGSSSATVSVWVIWGTVSFLFSGMTPSNAIPLWTNLAPGATNGPSDLMSYMPGYVLGVQYYTNLVNHPGTWAAAKECATITLSPPGIHSVISNGWVVIHETMLHEFKEGIQNIADGLYSDDWTYDGPNPWRCTQSPDANDKVYSIDAPNIGQNAWGATNSYEIHQDYQTYLQWNGTLCSSTNNYWHFEAGWKATNVPPIQHVNFGGGLVSPLPTAPEY